MPGAFSDSLSSWCSAVYIVWWVGLENSGLAASGIDTKDRVRSTVLCFVDCEVIQHVKVRIGRVHLLLHYSWNHGSAAFAVLDTKSHTGCNNAWSPAREKWMTLGDRVVVTTWCSTQLLFLNLMFTSIKQHDNMINSHQDSLGDVRTLI